MSQTRMKLLHTFAVTLLTCGVASAETVYSRGDVQISVTGPSVTVTSPGASEIVVAEVSNPPRIVVDLINEKQGDQRSVTVPSNEFLKGIRLGRHADKLRVVLDLVDSGTGAVPEFKESRSTSSVTFSFGALEGAPAVAVTTSTLSSTASTNAASSEKVTTSTIAPETAADAEPVTTSTQKQTTATAARTAAPLVPATTVTRPSVATRATVVTTSTSTSTLPVAEEPVQVPSLSATSAASPALDVAPGRLTLTAINFEAAERPSVRFVLNSRADFKLARRSDKEYLLIVQNCGIAAPYLQYPVFPPQDFDGFTHVLVTPVEQNAEIAIGVERGIKLTAFAKDDGIWVTAKK